MARLQRRRRLCCSARASSQPRPLPLPPPYYLLESLSLSPDTPILQDIFDPQITLLEPDAVQTSVATDAPNRTIAPHGELLFSFLGNKGTGGRWGRLEGSCRQGESGRASCGKRWDRRGGCKAGAGRERGARQVTAAAAAAAAHAGELNSSNPYNVGAVEQLAFNNLRCVMVQGVVPPPPAAQPPAAAPAAVVPTDVQVEYTPIEYLGQPIVSTFTQFLMRWAPRAAQAAGWGRAGWRRAPLAPPGAARASRP